jgi:hypothetical protein
MGDRNIYRNFLRGGAQRAEVQEALKSLVPPYRV